MKDLGDASETEQKEKNSVDGNLNKMIHKMKFL